MRDFENQQNELFLSFWAKVKWVGIWGFKRNKGNLQGEWKK